MNPPVRHIFMLGVTQGLRFVDFVALLRKNRVNCVVDTCISARISNGTVLNNLPAKLDESVTEAAFTNRNADAMRMALKREGFLYMTFAEEFCHSESAMRNKSSDAGYAKICTDSGFVRGIERLQNGMQKGYVILLLGPEQPILDSFRYKAIGRRLTELDYQVWHMMTDGSWSLQRTLEASAAQERMKQKERACHAAAFGRKGEDIAAEYLERHGFTILDRNWNLHRGCEIDIVAYRDSVVHFVEVKTRGKQAAISPEYAINWQKMRHIYKASRAYLTSHRLWNASCKFDSISIVMRGPDDFNLQFYEDIQYVERRYH